LKNQGLATSQGVVCKIHEPPFLVPQALLPAISFHLLGVVLAILLPVAWMGLAPLLRTLQADLPINRIGGDLLPMIFTTASALAWGLAANRLSRVISRGLKDLLTVTTTEIFHQALPNKMEGFWEAPLDAIRPAQRTSMGVSGPRKAAWLCGVRSSTRSSDLLGGLKIGCR
jgi:hypothetical protein